jgi:hypothetical protein
MAFRKVLVKSRASTSFTAELKDFVGPFDFFMSPKAQAATDIPFYCGIYGVSTLQVTNPVSTSIYEWSTPDGNIVGSTTGPSVTADFPGTYYVTQKLQSSCPAYATDTVVITYDASCSLLDNNLTRFIARIDKGNAILNWTVSNSSEIKYFEVERSTDGSRFSSVDKLYHGPDGNTEFQLLDSISNIQASNIFYRLKIVENYGKVSYSKIVSLAKSSNLVSVFTIAPNPVKDAVTINITASNENQIQIYFYNVNGKLIKTINSRVYKGSNTMKISGLNDWLSGVYVIKMTLGSEIRIGKMVVMH